MKVSVNSIFRAPDCCSSWNRKRTIAKCESIQVAVPQFCWITLHGVIMFEDVNKDGKLDAEDLIVLGCG